MIHRIALQTPDHDRPVLRAEHTGAFAQFLHRADAGTGRAQQVGIENRPGRSRQVAAGDFFDEARNIDVSRAGVRARRVEAVETAVGLDNGFLRR